jgi:hypothetical protein
MNLLTHAEEYASAVCPFVELSASKRGITQILETSAKRFYKKKGK